MAKRLSEINRLAFSFVWRTVLFCGLDKKIAPSSYQALSVVPLDM